MRRICVVTGTRADFGLLRWLMYEIREAGGLTLQVVATGMHLSPEYGNTYHEIEEAGFTIDYRVEMLLGANSKTGVTKSVGIGTIGFADAYTNLKPDLVVVLGDRFELLSAVTAALVGGIPVAHLHGGEVTEGAIDDSIRHSITKMSHIHFVAASEYAQRVIQLGEQPERVFLVGGLGIDGIKRMKLLDKTALEDSLGFKFGKKNLMVTFHPVTNEGNDSVHQMAELLGALDELEDTHLIFTISNADAGGRDLTDMLEVYVATRPHARLFQSLGQLRYLSCMQFIDGVVGNSSSGLTEAPSMKIGTINIGDRQKGRLFASSVIQCQPSRRDIGRALIRLYEGSFQLTLSETINPYGDGGASKKIVEVLREYIFSDLLKKSFYDLPMVTSGNAFGNRQ